MVRTTARGRSAAVFEWGKRTPRDSPRPRVPTPRVPVSGRTPVRPVCKENLMHLLPAFLAFTFITAFTPGPNNILALSTGVQRGFRKALPVILGICAGFLCVMLLCGILVFSLSSLSPAFMTAMKYAGCLYIVWLAWHIVASKDGQSAERPGADFMTGCILQFVNVKIMIYGMTAFSGFIFPWHRSLATLLAGMVVLTLIGAAGVVTWAIAGAALQRFFRDHATLMNAVMALLLLACLIPMLR